MELSEGARTSPLGVALVGAGMVSGIHLEAIAHAPERAVLRGVLARQPERAARLIEKRSSDLGIRPVAYADLDQLAGDASVDAVIILTPPNVRMELIAPLARAGKHILLEKPIARTLAEAEAVVALCEHARVRLGIVFQHRFRAASMAAQRLVQSGRLGRLGVVAAAVPWWRDQAYYDEPGRGSYARDGGGVLISQAIHTIDLMLSLTGPAAQVQAMTATSRFHRMEAEDFVSAGLTFANGAVGAVSAGTCNFPGSAETITLHFDAASLHLEAGILTVNWRDGTTQTHGAVGGTGGGADPMAFTHEWHQSVLEDFADAIRRGVAPGVTGRDGLVAHRLIDAIEESGRQNGRAVEVSS